MHEFSKEKLNQVLDDIINDRHEQAEVNFHDYLNDKMKTHIHGNKSSDDEKNINVSNREENGNEK